MVADRAADEHAIARPDPVGAEVDAGTQPADARRVDEEPVRGASGHHLGIARHHLHPARSAPRRGRCRRSACSVSMRQALLDDEGEAQVQGLGPAGGQVVDRPVHGQLADVAAGEDERADDIAVGRQDHAALDRRQHRPVGHRPQELVVEGREQDLADQPARQPRPLAVGQEDEVPGRPGHGTGEVRVHRGRILEAVVMAGTSTGWTAPCRSPGRTSSRPRTPPRSRPWGPRGGGRGCRACRTPRSLRGG